jgi:exopolysaccharide biosynthesis polyprenyl glycosylphosphotransferase
VCIAAGTICVGWLYILGPSKFTQYFGRGVLPAATLLCGIATTAIRYLVNRIYRLQEKGQELLYLGFSPSATGFIKELKNHSEVRSVTVASDTPLATESPRVSWSDKDIKDLLCQSNWQSVIVDPLFQASLSDTEALVKLRLAGTPVFTVADFYEKFWFMIPVTGIDNNWFLRSQGFSALDNTISQRLKRVIDLILSALLLIASIPVLAFCALMIKLTSKGPVLYKQRRVGLEGKPFTIIKLRTMVQNAESEGAQWATTNDPRTTWFGRFLRQTRLDEIPQCWNVLRGEMSFVGPRPERPEFTRELADEIPYYELRHLVKPGITGWAQVIFPYGASTEDSLKKLQYELFYIKNQSLLLDLNIMLRTLITVFQRAGR